MPRLSSRVYLLALILAALVPVWIFAGYLLFRYALNERERYEREALQTARQVGLVVEAELSNLRIAAEGLARSDEIKAGDFVALRREADRLVTDTSRVFIVRDLAGRSLLTTQTDPARAPSAVGTVSGKEMSRLVAGQAVVSGVYRQPGSGEPRVAVSVPAVGAEGARLFVSLSIPAREIYAAMMPALPPGWTLAVGDAEGRYVARSQDQDSFVGQPGLPDYLAKVVGTAGTFTARNFTGRTLLAGYYRSDLSGWFYTANVPLSTVEAPLWRSLLWTGAIGLLAMAVSTVLSLVVGTRLSSAARALAGRAEALGAGRPVEPLRTHVAEFAAISRSLQQARRTLSERVSELETVMETVPAAVWFTYDPAARKVIRNRFAAELMGLPAHERQGFGATETVIDTVAEKDGRVVSREDRPLSRAMRGELTDQAEFSYTLPDGTRRDLLSSARPIRNAAGETIGAVQISLDITERKRGEEQRKLLVHELNHRVKNTLAVVQAIATQSLRTATSLDEAGKAVASRLGLLAKAHDVLTQENWSGADLKELTIAALMPHAGLERFRLEGGRVRLKPSLALSLAMGLHELATNALKYGALSSEDGVVSISWAATGDGGLRVEWRESGGPPVARGERRGFGTRMLDRVLESEPSGRVTLAFDAAGVVCTFEIGPQAARAPEARESSAA